MSVVQDYYRPDARNGYACGFILLSYMMTPINLRQPERPDVRPGAEGLHEYSHTAAWCCTPRACPTNGTSITLIRAARRARSSRRTRHVPVEGQRREARAAARDKAAEMMSASARGKVHIGLSMGVYAMGSCRMGQDSKTSVVNEFARRTTSAISTSATRACS